MRQQDLGRRYKVPLLQDARVVEPAGKAFDAALGLLAIRDLRRAVGQLGARAGHDAADERGQGGQVSDKPAWWFAWVPLHQGSPYGTILAEVVTHRLLLLDWLLSPERIDDEATA